MEADEIIAVLQRRLKNVSEVANRYGRMSVEYQEQEDEAAAEYYERSAVYYRGQRDVLKDVLYVMGVEVE